MALNFTQIETLLKEILKKSFYVQSIFVLHIINVLFFSNLGEGEGERGNNALSIFPEAAVTASNQFTSFQNLFPITRKDFFFFFLMCTIIFLKSLLNLLQHFGYFWPQGPWLGSEPVPPALEGKALTTGLPGNSLQFFFLKLDQFIYLLIFGCAGSSSLLTDLL